VAAGDPAHVLGLIDEESLLWDEPPITLVVNVLGHDHTYLAEAFAGTVPAPGGPFTLGEWEESEWGPVLADASAWLGIRLEPEAPRHVGWGLLLDGVVEHVETRTDDVLTHVRGRYVGGS
jgi:hypothetical protein